MRRIQALSIVLTLLGVPLVLLAQSELGGAGCDRMCCLRQGHHAAQLAGESAGAHDSEMTCHHGDAGRALNCHMRANQSPEISSPIAPIPPMILSPAGRVAAPDFAHERPLSLQEKVSSGFFSPPFEPPRA